MRDQLGWQSECTVPGAHCSIGCSRKVYLLFTGRSLQSITLAWYEVGSFDPMNERKHLGHPSHALIQADLWLVRCVLWQRLTDELITSSCHLNPMFSAFSMKYQDYKKRGASAVQTLTRDSVLSRFLLLTDHSSLICSNELFTVTNSNREFLWTLSYSVKKIEVF